MGRVPPTTLRCVVGYKQPTAEINTGAARGCHLRAMRPLPLPPLLTLLFIRTAAGQAEFLGLPDTVRLPESSAIGTSVHSFRLVNCSSADPGVTITSVTPAATFFNTPTQRRITSSEYSLQISLSSAAALNAKTVNQYTLQISATCGSATVTGQLSIIIIDDLPEPQCEPTFTSPGGHRVRVYSDLPASSPVYVVVLRQPKYTPVTFQITSPSPSPFTISPSGVVSSPAAGFTNAAADHTLQISVTDSRGNTCNGALRVEVLPVYHNPINFTSSSFNFTIPENGNARYLVGQLTASGRDLLYEMITPNINYYIESGTGTIRSTYNLDLDATPALATSVLQVRVYDRYQRTNSATATVTISVTDVNDLAPRCSPAIVVTQVPQTQPVGSVLADFSCTDPDYNRTSLTYSIIPNSNSLHSFRIHNSQLQINNTLDYDSYAMEAVSFQYSATVQVTDSATPQMTTFIPVFVTVTAVNNYKPKCVGPFNFSVSEDAPFGTAVGTLNATDADYPFNKVEYRITGGPSNPAIFYIMPRTGQITLLGPLDYEKRTSYRLTIRVVDLDNDITPDPTNQRPTSCDIFINVLDYNDEPPVCTPPFDRRTIYSTDPPAVLTLSCQDTDGTQRPLFYTITGGNDNGRFEMFGATLRHGTFSYNPDGISDPTQYELLIRVTDSLSPPTFSTTATVYVTVIPWSTTPPSTTTTTTTAEPQTLIVTKQHQYWKPDIWFMVVLTLTGALFLAAVGLLTWALCRRSPICGRGSGEATEPLLQDSSLQNPEQPANPNRPPAPSKEKKELAPVSPLSLQFDGRAQDPLTGREYLFNSVTGERRWV